MRRRDDVTLDPTRSRTMQPDLTSYRYVILAEGQFHPLRSKTANSAVRYLPDRAAAERRASR